MSDKVGLTIRGMLGTPALKWNTSARERFRKLAAKLIAASYGVVVAGRCTCSILVGMEGFTPPRDRDAWGVIRGFVYQVDTTILRWLDLRDDQSLELERGEDIDLVTRAVQAEAAEQERLLEQVKNRQRRITLRAPEAAEAIANALEHRTRNPDLSLVFRFTTNSTAGREKLSPLPKGQSGIGAWQLLHGGKAKPEQTSVLIAGIRQIVSTAIRPRDIPAETWEQLVSFLEQADDTEVSRFIRSFEWSLGQDSPESMSNTIVSRLVEKGRAADKVAGETLYQRLFLFCSNC